MTVNYNSLLSKQLIEAKWVNNNVFPAGNEIIGKPGWSRYLSFLVLALCMMAGINAGAQNMANYTFSSGTTGSLEDMSAGATSIMTVAEHDDDPTTVQAIGFDFYFMGVRYTHFSANSNGQVRLHTSSGASAIGGASITGYSASTVTLAPMAGDNELTGGMKMKVVGSAPNRKLVVEWTTFYLNWTPSLTNAGNMQLWLSENGVIDFVYGEMYNSSSSSVNKSIFISSGNTAGASMYVTIGNPPAFNNTATTPVTNTIAAGSGTSTGSPLVANLGSAANGSRRVFTFTPPSTAPSNPTLGTFTAVTASTSTVNWTDNSTNESFYIITRATDAGFTQNVVTTTVASTSVAGTGSAYSSVQSGLTPGTIYYYRVQAANEGVAPSAGVTGSQATSAAAVYYWVGASGSTWNTANNWNTEPNLTGSFRNTPATTDILVIDGAGTTAGAASVINIDNNYSIGALRITNNTIVTLQSTAGTTRTITLTGSAANELDVPSGSTLQLNNATNAVAIIFSGAGNTGNIAGTLTVGGSTSNNLSTTGGTGTLVTVASGGVVNLDAASAGLTGSTATLTFANGSSCNRGGYTTSAPAIPLATWGATSTLTITGLTTATGPTNGNQSFGNVTYNCPASTVTFNFFGSTSTSIQGNLTVQATNSGRFRFTTTATINVAGNINVSGGTCEISSSSGLVIVAGNVNLSGGTLDLTSGTGVVATLRVAGAFNQTGGSFNASATGTSPQNLVEFNGTSAQNVTFTSVGSGGINYRVNNAAGINLTGNMVINQGAGLRITNGNITGSGSVTYNATSSRLTYDGSTGVQIATAQEWPASNGPVNVTINNTNAAPNNTVTVPFNRSLPSAGVLTLTSGMFNNTGFTLTLNNTATGAITGHTTAKYIIGALERTLPAGLATGSTYIFPVGKGTYNPFELVNPVTTAGGTVVVKAEVFDAASGGTAGTGMTTVNSNRYWAASITSGSGNFTDTNIRLTDTATNAITAASAIGTSATANGSYALVGGSIPTIVAGTSILSTAPKATSLPGFFTIGDKGVDMAYVSSTTTQSSTAVIIKPQVNQQIVRLEVVMQGNINQLSATQVDLSTAGSTSDADIARATVYYTGTSTTFATTTEFGHVDNPSGAFSVTGSQQLAEGTNYFWVTYDIPDTATANNVVDAQVLGLVLSNSVTPNVPTVTDPAGTRMIKAALAGDYVIGAGQTYTTLTAAVTDLNLVGVSAPVRFLLNGTYTAGETFPIVINEFPGASSTNTVTIMPDPNTTATATISGSGTSIIKLNGADYVIIDGNNGTSNGSLTIENTSTSTTSAVVWNGSASAANGALNNIFRNLVVKGQAPLTTFCGIFSGSGTTMGNAAEATNNNCVIQNNTVIKSQYGVAVAGFSGQTGNVISNNTIGSSTASDYIGFIGMFVSNNTGIQVNNNIIQNIITTANNPMGINISTGVVNSTFDSNIVKSIRYTGTSGYGGKGININTGSLTSSLTLSNNMISDIGGDGWSNLMGDSTVGIRIGANGNSTTTTTGGINLYNNTVNLGSGAFTGNSSGTLSAAIYLSSTVNNINLRNNILYSNLQNSNAGSAKTYALYSASANTAFTAIDYNDYAVGGSQGVLGFIGSDRTDLAAIQTGFGSNVNSKTIAPVFTSVTDAHLVPANNIGLNDLGTPIAGITLDIDGQSRNGTTPDMGADEFTPPGCTEAVGGTAVAASEICASGSTTVSATGYTVGLTITYQWQSSTDMAFTSPVDIGTASSSYSNLTTGTISATTYYRLKVYCGDGDVTGYSTVATVTVNNSSLTATADGERCGIGTVELSATGSAGTTVRWYAQASGGSVLHTGETFTTPEISATTNYYAEAVGGTITSGAGLASAGSYGTFSAPGSANYGIRFTTTSTGQLVSVAGYPNAAGNISLRLYNDAGTAVSAAQTFAVTSGQIGTKVVFTLNLEIPAAGTYRLVETSSGLLRRYSTYSGPAYPMTSGGAISVIGSVTSIAGTPATNSYTGIFDFIFQSGCTSAREEVTATVNTPPALTLSSASDSVCPGGATDLVTVTAGLADYDIFDVTSNPPGAAYGGNAQDGYTFSPTVPTVYTITATETGGDECKTTTTFSVTIDTLPAAITVTPENQAICAGEVVALTASGGGDVVTILTENFNAAPAGWTTVNNSVFGLDTNASAWTLRADGYLGTFHSNDSSQIYVSNSDAQGSDDDDLQFTETYLISPVFSLSGYTSASLNFYHYYRFVSGDVASVDISTNGGTNWTSLQAFTATTGAPAAFASQSIDLADYAGMSNLKIRFRYESNYGWYWAIDNVSITSQLPPAVTWSPQAGLYTDAGATTPYAGEEVGVVYAKVSQATVFTATATNAAGCSVTDTASITISTKTWNGSVSTDWNEPANWCGNQVPASTDNIFIPNVANQPSITGNSSGEANQIIVQNGAVLTVTSGSDLIVTNELIVGATANVVVQDNANLIQINNVANTGNIDVHKNSSPLYRLDYTFWSSPVAGQQLQAFSPGTLSNRFYIYDTAPDAYTAIDPTGNFEIGKGYLIRMPNTWPEFVDEGTPGTSWAGTFRGVPNNGNITADVSSEGERYNAVGNPYPSPISVVDFLAANSGTLDSGSGLYFWRKRNNPNVSSYSSITMLGFADNEVPGGGDNEAFFPDASPSVWVINPGQGFIVRTDIGAVTDVAFTNGMRRGTNNGQFFRDGDQPEISRFRLNMSGTASGQFGQAIIGYTSITTTGLDYGWDGRSLSDGAVTLFSVNDDVRLAIQARAAFDVNDVVPVGYTTEEPGSYTIALGTFDGVFEGGQDIYLVDKVTEVTHNLKDGSYTFDTEAGEFTERFEVVYMHEILNTNNPELNSNNVIVYKQGHELHINSGSADMLDVTIYDTRGRMLYGRQGINAAKTVIGDLQAQEQVLIVNINTTKGKVSKKVIY